jgi:hypothetical protein
VSLSGALLVALPSRYSTGVAAPADVERMKETQ